MIPLGGRAKEERGLHRASQRILMISLPLLVHYLFTKNDAASFCLSPTFLSSQDIYSQIFTGPTPSPVSLLQEGRERHISFAEKLENPGFFVFKAISTEG